MGVVKGNSDFLQFCLSMCMGTNHCVWGCGVTKQLVGVSSLFLPRSEGELRSSSLAASTSPCEGTHPVCRPPPEARQERKRSMEGSQGLLTEKQGPRRDRWTDGQKTSDTQRRMRSDSR